MVAQSPAEQLGIKPPPNPITTGPESRMMDRSFAELASLGGTGSVGGTLTPPVPVGGIDPHIRAAAGENAAEFVSGAPGYPKMGRAVKKYAGTFDRSKYPTQEAENAARTESGTELLRGAGEAATPLMILGGATAPAKVAAGIGVGYLASKGVGAAADALGATPETKEFSQEVTWFLPSALALASGLQTRPLPEEVGDGTMGEMFGGKVKFAGGRSGNTVGGSVQVGDRPPITARVRVPGMPEATAEATSKPAGALEDPTIPDYRPTATGARPMPPSDIAPPSPSQDIGAATTAMAQKQASENAAARVARGLPPVPPPPPAPAPPMVNDQTAAAVGEAIKSLPPEQQPAAILEVTKRAADSILHHGGAVIDRKVYPVTSARESLDLAKMIVKSEIAKLAPLSTVDSQEETNGDNALFHRANQELGEDRSIFQDANRAQQLKDLAAHPQAPSPRANAKTPAKPNIPSELPPDGNKAVDLPVQGQIAAERRQNSVERKRVAEMSIGEMQRELLTSQTTGLPNRRAFDEAEHTPAPAVAMSDADGLKAINDKFGYQAGDALLRAKADALREAGLEAYHEKGDEFLYRGESPEALTSKLDQARAILREKTIGIVLDDGSQLKFKGGDFSYGTGRHLSEAEAGLKAHKSEREARGERARGELRGITATQSQAGEENQGRGWPLGGREPEREVVSAPSAGQPRPSPAALESTPSAGTKENVEGTQEKTGRPAEDLQPDTTREAAEGPAGRTEPAAKGQLGSQRGAASLGAILTPITAPIQIVKRLNSAYDRFADATLQKMHLGRPLPEVEAVDPGIAERFREYRAAPQYFRTKADHIVEKIVGDLTREQEKGFVLLADKESNDWLNENHHDEWIRYMDDPDIEVALAKYKPYENELREAQRALGGPVIEEDYLRRVYPKYVAGINKAKGGEVATFDRVITPQMANKKSRSASPSYFYKNGLHEFAPSFATRYVATHLKVLESRIAGDFMSKATKIDAGDSMPAYIDYNGDRYFSHEAIGLIKMSRANSAEGKRLAEELGIDQLPKPGELQPYGVYTPFTGSRLEFAARSMAENAIRTGDFAETIKPDERTPDTDSVLNSLLERNKGDAYGVLNRLSLRYLAPVPVIDAMERDGRDIVPQWVKDFSQVSGPIVGAIRQQLLITGIPHIKNILRRVMQQSPGAQMDPRSWYRAWKILFDKELKERALKGIDDPTFNALLKHAGISTEGAINYEHYLNFNFEEGSWKNLWGTRDALSEAFSEPGLKGKAHAIGVVAGEVILLPQSFRIGKWWHDKLFGPGGIDPRARLYLADLIKSQDPTITDAQISERLNDQLGRYARSSWTDLQRAMAPFVMFPGWTYSSANWVLKHPLRTILPAAFLILLANAVLYHYGKNRHKDKYDYKRIHAGGRSWTDTMLRERMALDNPMVQVSMEYAKARAQGRRSGGALGIALSGLTGDAGAFLGEANPLVITPVEVAMNRRNLFSHEPIHKKRDWGRRGLLIPKPAGGKGAEEVVRYGAGKLFPQIDAAYPNEGAGMDWTGFLGRNVGTSNYADHGRRSAGGAGIFGMSLDSDSPTVTPQATPPAGFEMEEPDTNLNPDELKPKKISTGDTVRMKDGSLGEVAYVHPQMNIARVRVGGRTRTVNLAELN
jgi:GGDEF domain-containing protein